MQKMKFILINIIVLVLLVSCSDDSIIYENSEEINSELKIQLNEVKIADETPTTLTVDFTYTYENSIPAEEVKLYILPDHAYWSTNPVKISYGKNSARAAIGISKSNMQKDNVTESETKILRFRFDHYPPGKFNGNIWGIDVNYLKKWKK